MSSSSSRLSGEPIKGGFYPSWDETLTPAGIETKYFTHIFYAFLNPEPDFKLNISQNEARKLQNFTNTLHAKRPAVKTLFAVGGSSAGTAVLSPMASNAQSRAAFIRSTIDVARRYGFDGVDLDWEFPANQRDMDNLGSLVQEWRVEVHNDARTTGKAPLLLTASVYFEAVFSWDGPRAHPARSMAENLDFINVMTYNFYGEWDKPLATGAHSALYAPSPKHNMSTRVGLQSWIDAGVPSSKLVMGLPLFGRTWTLENLRLSTGLGSPAVGVGPGVDGFLYYADVVRFNRENGAMVVQHQATGSVYSYAGKVWISYDNIWSVANKIDYARNQLGLGGYFFWDVCGDDEHWNISRAATSNYMDTTRVKMKSVIRSITKVDRARLVIYGCMG